LGYASLTPKDNPSPIVTFRLRDGAAARTKLQRANVIVTLRIDPAGTSQMRVSPSIFNNQADVDRLIGALA
jgi:selenocysteine lyase/cysteine desulfurase